MKTTRSGQGRSPEQLKRNHEVLDLITRIFAAIVYFVVCYQIANYMINN